MRTTVVTIFRKPGEFTRTIAEAALLYCPSDLWHPTQPHWAQEDLAAISYEILAPGADTGAASLAELSASNLTYRLEAPGIHANVNPSERLVTCPIHENHVDTDGSVQTYRIPTASAGDEGYYDVIVHDAQGGYQLSYLADVRVEPVTNAWEAVDFGDLSYTLETGLPTEPGTNVVATCRVHRYRVESGGAVKLGEVPPTIVTQPSSQTPFAGRRLLLGVGAIGDLQNRQWYRDGEAITGETNSTLTLPSLVETNTASYYAIVSNPWGSATSHVAVVTVNPIPPPHLRAVVTSLGVELALGIAGPAGVECRLEVSPDLNTWTTLTPTVLTEGVFMFLQRMDALPAVRFYRATLR